MTGKKIQRALRDLNAFIDGDRQKLCDELHEIKLSQKRLENLVREFVKAARTDCIDMDYFGRLVMRAEAELIYPYYRVNHRVKGGKDA